MAAARLFADPNAPTAYYHCVSRVVDRRFVLMEEEREHFVRLLRAYETFCQVQVVTFCVMSNHFHVLVEIQPRPQGATFSDEWLLKQVSAISSQKAQVILQETLETLRREGDERGAEELKEQYLGRMWDVSQFMKEFKQRFSLWYNKRAERKGTLWEERFNSVLVQGAGTALAIMAAYIDLNPVRAKMVSDPKDYRWSGYGEAVAGVKRALAGVQLAVEGCFGKETEQAKAKAWLEEYRVWMFGRGEERKNGEDGEVVRKGLSKEQVEKVRGQEGKLSRVEMLRCRVRYFTQGAVIGTRSYVESVFELRRERFGAKRTEGAKRMKGADFGGLCSIRDLTMAVLH